MNYYEEEQDLNKAQFKSKIRNDVKPEKSNQNKKVIIKDKLNFTKKNLGSTTFFGRLGHDPRLTRTDGKKSFCTFSVAIKQKGKEEPKWANVLVWDTKALKVANTFQKGDKVFITGEAIGKKYKAEDGEMKSIVEVHTSEVGAIV